MLQKTNTHIFQYFEKRKNVWLHLWKLVTIFNTVSQYTTSRELAVLQHFQLHVAESISRLFFQAGLQKIQQ